MDSSQSLDKDLARVEAVKQRLKSRSKHFEEGTSEGTSEAFDKTFRQTNSILAKLPCRIARSFCTESKVMSMEFHPFNHTLLLVGYRSGGIALWDLCKGKKLASEQFKIDDGKITNLDFQWLIAKDSSVSITRVTWSRGGYKIGVAYTKNLIRLFSYEETKTDKLGKPLEINAHMGCVNDIAFCEVNKKLAVVTCGDDKLIKIWGCDGNHLYSYEGHSAPGVCVCPRQVENTLVVLSTAIGENIKIWSPDKDFPISVAEYNASGCKYTSVISRLNDTRLFCCGHKDGKSDLFELDKGRRKRTYTGFINKSIGVIHFDASNDFLAAGEENDIMFWDMNKAHYITRTKANDALPSFPRLKFNRKGNLLAVTTKSEGFMIMANNDGLRSLRPVLCSFYTLEDPVGLPCKVHGLLYIIGGCSLIALKSNGYHDKWDWKEGDDGLTLQVNITERPRYVSRKWKLNNALEEVPSCMALSKSKEYVLSASGRQFSRISLNTNDMKVLEVEDSYTDLFPTFIAFHPRDPLYILLGMNNAKIMIHHIEKGALENETLTNHHKENVPTSEQSQISGLAFSEKLNIMLSTDVNPEIWKWTMKPLNSSDPSNLSDPSNMSDPSDPSNLSDPSDPLNLLKKRPTLFQWNEHIPLRFTNTGIEVPKGDTRIQFHEDETKFLVIHPAQLAIYHAHKMKCIEEWLPEDGHIISSAAYSCDSTLVFASFKDGYIRVLLGDTLTVLQQISPSAYVSPSVDSQISDVYPIIIATHPNKSNQLAVGLSNGMVTVIEPSELTWQKQHLEYLLGWSNCLRVGAR